MRVTCVWFQGGNRRWTAVVSLPNPGLHPRLQALVTAAVHDARTSRWRAVEMQRVLEGQLRGAASLVKVRALIHRYPRS